MNARDSNAGAGDASEPPGGGLQFWGPAVIASISIFLGVLDTTMMNVAVPSIVLDLNTTVSSMQTAIAVYSMVMAALIIPGGALRAAVDSRRLLLVTLAIYSVGTLVAGVSPSFVILFLGWSVVEGVAAALLLPTTYSIVVENYDGANRAKAFGAIGGMMAVGVAVGPMIGGTLTTYGSWRWGLIGEFFVVLVIVGLTLRYLPAKPSEESVALDAGGTILSILGVVGIVGGSLIAGAYGWVRPLRPFVVAGTTIQPLGLSPAIWAIGIGLAFLVAFVRWELRQHRADRPVLIPPAVLRNRTFAAGTSTFASESLFLAGFMFTLPLFLQSALGFSAFDAGVALLPFSVATLVLAVVSTGWREYLAQKHIIIVGLSLVALGLVMLMSRLSLDLTIRAMVLPMLVVGAGIGLFQGQVVDLTMSAVPSSESDVSSGVINSTSQLGYAFGTAVAGSLLLTQFYGGVVTGVARVRGQASISAATRRQLAVKLETALETTTNAQQQAFVDGLPPAARQQVTAVVRDSMVTAQVSVMAALVLFVLLTILVSSFLPVREPRRRRSEKSPVAAPEEGSASTSE